MRSIAALILAVLTLFVTGCGEKENDSPQGKVSQSSGSSAIVGKIARDDTLLGKWILDTLENRDVKGSIEFFGDGTFVSTHIGSGIWGRIADGRVKIEFLKEGQGKQMRIYEETKGYVSNVGGKKLVKGLMVGSTTGIGIERSINN